MAAPQQYIGLGGDAPAIANGIPGEGTDEYRETYRPQPFGAAGTGNIAADQTQIPGRPNEVTLTALASLTRGPASVTGNASGTRRQVITSSVTHNPPPHVEYGRISEN